MNDPVKALHILALGCLVIAARQEHPEIPPAAPGLFSKKGREAYLRLECGRCHGDKKKARDLFGAGPLASKGWWAAFLAKSEDFRPGSTVADHSAVTPRDAEMLAEYLIPFQRKRMRRRSEEMARLPEPPKAPPDLKRAEELYRLRCAACHGVKGRGDGPLARYFEEEAHPRSFVMGRFRRNDPTPEDIYLTITRGMPGSGMTAFPSMSDRDRWSLAHYVLKFSPFPPPAAPREIPDPPKATRELVTNGEFLFLRLGCRVCHGRELKGLRRGTFFSWADEAGRPLLRSRDLRSGIYRTGSDPRSLYREFVYGRGGTPMPSFETILHTEERRWALVYYVRSLFDPELQRLRDEK